MAVVRDPVCDLRFDGLMSVRLRVSVKGRDKRQRERERERERERGRDERKVIERRGDESETR
jgi:hypothetical protein